MQKASIAFQKEDWQTAQQLLDQAQTLRPYSLFLIRNRILARQLSGDTEGALALAKTAADRGLTLNLSGHPGFDTLRTEEAFKPIKEKYEMNATPFGESVVLTLRENADLVPEAIAVDKKGRQLVGSVRTGAILDVSTEYSDPIAVAQGGVFDIEIRGKRIWAAVNNQLAYENADPDAKFSSIMVFNRKTGAPIREIRINEPDTLLGDLEVARDRTAYASDSVTPRIFKMIPKGQTLDIFVDDPRFVNLQGIALDEKNDRLFVADYLRGIFVIDTNTARVTEIRNTVDAHLGGIDGLYLYKGDLIGIQNGTTPHRIVRITLNDNATEAIGFNVLQRALPEWNEPTHGVVVQDRLEYTATSNWPSYDNEWNAREDAPPQPLRIMSAPLD